MRVALALTLALTRTAISLALVRNHLEVPVARCAATRLVGEFTLAQLNDPDPHVDPQRILRIIAPCREQA